MNEETDITKQGTAVFVDEAVWPYGRMMMCHMFSGDLKSLHEMADKIGVARKWFQNKPHFPHYDICKSKREIAVGLGAIQVNRREFVALAKGFRSESGQRHLALQNYQPS